MGLRPQQNCFASLRTFFALVLVLTLAGLSGCVTRTVDARGQVVTRSETKAPSDESETHKRSRIRLELASNYFEAGQTNVALDEVRQALAIDANNPDAHNLRGLIYLQLNDHAQAEESFRRALALRPQDASTIICRQMFSPLPHVARTACRKCLCFPFRCRDQSKAQRRHLLD